MTMITKTVTEIITNHLNGKSLREIANELDISKDAAANVIKDWKNGKINFFQNAISFHPFIWTRATGISSKAMPAFFRYLARSIMKLSSGMAF